MTKPLLILSAAAAFLALPFDGAGAYAPTHRDPSSRSETDVRVASALGMVKQGQRRRDREEKRCRDIERKIQEQIALNRPEKQGAKRMAQLKAMKAEAGCDF